MHKGLHQHQRLNQPAKFEKETYSYGVFKQGGNGTCEFKFKNTGSEPLIIYCVYSSCGCLCPIYPKDPVMPGETGVIKGVYDSNRVGRFTKTLRVCSNAKNGAYKTLTICGETYGPANTPTKKYIRNYNDCNCGQKDMQKQELLFQRQADSATANSSFSIRCYPNPVYTEATIQANKPLKNATITIFNALGEQVKEIKYISEQTVTFERDNLPGGLYFINVMQEGKVMATAKLIVAD